MNPGTKTVTQNGAGGQQPVALSRRPAGADSPFARQNGGQVQDYKHVNPFQAGKAPGSEKEARVMY